MTDTVKVKVFNGNPSVVSTEGYMVVRGENVIAFYVDIRDSHTGRLYPMSTCTQAFDHATREVFDYPCMTMETGDEKDMSLIDIAFPDFPGWQVHSVFGGKTLSICLVKHE